MRTVARVANPAAPGLHTAHRGDAAQGAAPTPAQTTTTTTEAAQPPAPMKALPYPDDAQRGRQGHALRRHRARSVPLARGRRSARGPGVDEGAGRARARRARASCPGATRIAARLKELFYFDSHRRAAHRGDRYFYTRRHADQGEDDRLLEGGQGRRRAGAARSQHLVDRRHASRSAGGGRRWDGKRVAYAVTSNNSDEATLLRHGRRDRQGARRRRHRRRQVRATPRGRPTGDGFYYTWVPPIRAIADARSARASPRCASTSSATIRRRTRSCTSDAATRDVPRRRALARRPLAARSPSSTAGTRPTSTSRTCATQGRRLDAARRGHRRALLGRGLQGPVLRHDQRRRAALPRLPRRSEEARARRVEGDRPRAARTRRSTARPVVGGHLALAVPARTRRASSRSATLDGKLVRDVALPGVGTARRPDRRRRRGRRPTSRSRRSPRRSEIYETVDEDRARPTLYAKVKRAGRPDALTSSSRCSIRRRTARKISMFIVHRKDLKKDGTHAARCSTATAASTSPRRRVVHRVDLPVARARRRLRDAEPARRRRVRRGVAPGRDAGTRSRTCSTTSSARPSTSSRRATRSREQLAICGGSNGGLLVGAAITQRPELFRAVVCAVPLLDMVRYHLFGSGKTWISEYRIAGTEASCNPPSNPWC